MPTSPELCLGAWARLLVGTLVMLFTTAAAAQGDYQRALELEQADKLPEAAAAYRQALTAEPASLPAVLGLERVYAQLGRSDSLLPVLDTAIARMPRAAAFRAAQLRTLRALGDPERTRAAFERWRREWPHDPTPYREYARMLIQDGATMSADSVLRRAQADLGTGRGFDYEMAQLRAANGMWELSAQSWRDAVSDNPYLDQAAIFSLTPTPAPSREAVRRTLRAARELGPRKVLAGIDLAWGAPRDGWEALRDLGSADTAVVHAWLDFARKAEDVGAWLIARDALVATFEEQGGSELASRAASDALSGGDAAGAVRLAELAEKGATTEGSYAAALAVHLRALATLGRAEEAERLLAAKQGSLPEDIRPSMNQLLAWAWIRHGDVARARQLIAAGGGTPDPEVQGWLALYDGDLATARRLLATSQQTSSELVLALSLLARTRVDSAPPVGSAFLALARGDSASAAVQFERASGTLPDASSLLLAASARLRTARREDAAAVPLWQSIVERYPTTPEAPEAELEWARALRRQKRDADAIVRLEHLILTYPQSALVPQARRELELARGTVPPTS